MDLTTLEKANEINKRIKEFSHALNCFQWPSEYGGGTRNPRLSIEVDDEDGGRETLLIPWNLSDALVSYLKLEIIAGRDAAVAEFNAL
jgi:hypothetical protein